MVRISRILCAVCRRRESYDAQPVCGSTRCRVWAPPTTEEIRNARPLATVLPRDALTHAVLIAAA
jgi:hypothetical protein